MRCNVRRNLTHTWDDIGNLGLFPDSTILMEESEENVYASCHCVHS